MTEVLQFLDFSNLDFEKLNKFKKTFGHKLLIGEGDTKNFITKCENYDIFLCYPPSMAMHDGYEIFKQNVKLITGTTNKVIMTIDLCNSHQVELFCNIFFNFFNFVKLEMDAKSMELHDIEKILAPGGKYEPEIYSVPTFANIGDIAKEISLINSSGTLKCIPTGICIDPVPCKNINKSFRVTYDKINNDQLLIIALTLCEWIQQLRNDQYDISSGAFYLEKSIYTKKINTTNKEELLSYIADSLTIINFLLMNFTVKLPCSLYAHMKGKKYVYVKLN